ncbi:DUF397 domain-containing protein [Streptomyces sp. NPDC093252]|uniref:DUF397 domain-containing protein n=1 Tax=Streptomyces sp. NPDC093252 TaxID=3154980 RepID=UPI003427528A
MMTQSDLSTAVFTKSTYSNGGNNCVEVAAVPGITAFRDSKDHTRGLVPASADAFGVFMEALKTGHLG